MAQTAVPDVAGAYRENLGLSFGSTGSAAMQLGLRSLRRP